MKKHKLSEKNDLSTEKSPTSAGLKYLFKCYKRIDLEELEYPKVKKKF